MCNSGAGAGALYFSPTRSPVWLLPCHWVQLNDDEDDNVKWWRFLQHLYKWCACDVRQHQPKINQIAIKCLLFWQKQDKHFYERSLGIDGSKRRRGVDCLRDAQWTIDATKKKYCKDIYFRITAAAVVVFVAAAAAAIRGRDKLDILCKRT